MLLSNPLRAEQRIRQMAEGGLRIAVVVPCYNVEDHIIEVVETIPNYVSNVVLIDDGSSDRTGELIDRLACDRVTGIHLSQNRGVGEAMLKGFAKAVEIGADVHERLLHTAHPLPRRLLLYFIEHRHDFILELIVNRACV